MITRLRIPVNTGNELFVSAAKGKNGAKEAGGSCADRRAVGAERRCRGLQAFALFVGLRRARWARMEKPRGASLPWITGFCAVRGLTPRALGADGETARSVITVDYRLLHCSWAYAARAGRGWRNRAERRCRGLQAFALFVGLRRARWARMEKPRGASLPWITGFCAVRGLSSAHGCAGGRADWKSYAALFALAKAAMGAFRAGTPHACRNLVVTKCAAM